MLSLKVKLLLKFLEIICYWLHPVLEQENFKKVLLLRIILAVSLRAEGGMRGEH